MSRVSLGWLPASNLRLMPAFYRGVSPVIDHDRSSPPGLNGHSTVKPVLPPTLWEELVVEEEDFESKGFPALLYSACGCGRRLVTGSCVYLRDDPDGLSAV